MQPHRLMGQRVNHVQFHHPVRQQAQVPVVVALGGRAAGQGDQVGFAPVVQLAVPVGLGPVPERPVQPILGETPLDAEHRALGHIQSLRHLGGGPALTGLEQDAGPGRNPGRTPPRPDHVLQLVAFLRRQPNRKFLSDHTDTSQQHIP